MNRVLRACALVGAVLAMASAGLLATGAPANAADSAVAVGRAKAEITRRIDLRLVALTRFDNTATNAKHLTDAHEATLRALIAEDTSGLKALKTKVAGETTLAALKADAASMVNDYRVFLLVGPKVRLSVVGDTEEFGISRLRTAHDKLAELVAKAKADGKDTAAAEQNLADMAAALDKAAAAINGQVTTLLAIAAGPDGAAISSKVRAVRTALGNGRKNMATAAAEAKQVRDFLRGLTK